MARWAILLLLFLPLMVLAQGYQPGDGNYKVVYSPNGPIWYFVDNSGALNTIQTPGSGEVLLNVKSYGAKGDGTTDDTVAINAAMTAFCNAGPLGGGSIYFPPGEYVVNQPQSNSPSTIPFTIGCQNMHFLGGDQQSPSTGTAMPPQVSINARCGSAPNAMPMFEVNYPNQNAHFENLIINGCNEAIASPGQWLFLTNATLSASTTGLVHNAALWIYDTFNVYITGGALVTGSSSVPTLLMTSEACSGCYQGVGNVYIENTFFDGGGLLFTADAPGSGANPGNWHFKNDIWESGNGPFLTIQDPLGNTIGGVNNITMEGVQIDDNAGVNPSLITLNVPSNFGPLSGVFIVNSNSVFNAIVVQSGHVDSYFIQGCNDNAECGLGVFDASGNPIGSGTQTGRQGLDIITDTTLDNSTSHLFTFPPILFGNTKGDGPALRVFESGDDFASYLIDAVNGFSFANPLQNGNNAQLYQATAPNIDAAFAANYPPTGVSAVPSNTGGTLAAGTYYIWMVSTIGSSCSSGTFSGGSPIAGPYTITGNTGSLAVSWTAAAPGLTPILGYCVLTEPTKIYGETASASAFISGASTTTATVTSFPNAPFPAPFFGPTMVQEDHITQYGFKTDPLAFSTLPNCSSTYEGLRRSVNDSTTSTWGATITGSGTNHVEAYCDGTNWTVGAK